MVQVQELYETLHLSALGDLLLTHASCDLSWLAFDTHNQTVTELLILRPRTPLRYLGALLIGAHKYSLLATEASGSDDDESTWFQTNMSNESVYNLPIFSLLDIYFFKKIFRTPCFKKLMSHILMDVPRLVLTVLEDRK